MKKVDVEAIRKFYNETPDIWPVNDTWHTYSREQIETCLLKCDFLHGSSILNAGSGGNSYSFDSNKTMHVDIAEEKISNYKNKLVASIEDLPLEANQFDNIVCVGSVINYCDPISAIAELCRVLKPGGRIVLEFESSWGYEYIGQNSYKQVAVLENIEFHGEMHAQWLFSPKYIKGILHTFNLKIEKEYRFHIMSGLSLRFYNEVSAVNKARRLDWFVKKIPYIDSVI